MQTSFVLLLTVSVVTFGFMNSVHSEVPAAYQACIACHGSAGEGNAALAAPALAGQQAAYIERQLQNFQAGIRGADAKDVLGAQMRAMAATLSSKDIPAVAAYVASLPAQRYSVAEGVDLMNGNNYYQSKCGACHGGKAQGNVGLNAPALANLDAAYLTRQFENFQQGLRGAHPDDKYGRQMKMMSTSLPTEKDLSDVIGFIHAQSSGSSGRVLAGRILSTFMWVVVVFTTVASLATFASDIASEIASDAARDLPPDFQLRDQCPPSFEKTPAGRCKLRTLYELYSSVQGKGLGGTQTALPDHRDGFTPQQIDLGRYLFFDPALSGNGTLSCASCHQPDQGFADGLPRSIGIGGRQVSRAAPTLWNVAFLQRFMWDARAHTLEEQVLGPLYSPVEMGNTPAQLLSTLNENPAYRALFRAAYTKASDADIVLEEVYLSLAAFQTSLISLNSRYDHYAHGYHDALDDQEVEGLNIFRSFVARCAECHTPPLFTNQQVAVIGAPEPEGLPLDIGAQKTFNAPKLKAAFKVPTLRNVALTAPYMHSGVFDTLRATTEFYNKGRGHAVPQGLDLHLHWHMSSPNLTDYELDRLVDFLGTLTDESLKPQVPSAVPSGLTPVSHPLSSHPLNREAVAVKALPLAAASTNVPAGVLTTAITQQSGDSP